MTSHTNPQLGQIWEYTSIFGESHQYLLTSIVNNKCYGLVISSSMVNYGNNIGTIVLLESVNRMKFKHGWSILIDV